MKGYLQKTEQGWVVLYEQRSWQDPSAEDGMLPLYIQNEVNILENKDYFNYYSGKEVEFEIVKLYDDKYGHELTYAKLVRKTVQTDENGKPLTYWGGLTNPDVDKLAEEVYGKGVNHDYEEGYVDGYNKAKEVLYTKEEMLECWNTSIIDITTFETFIELLKHPKK